MGQIINQDTIQAEEAAKKAILMELSKNKWPLADDFEKVGAVSGENMKNTKYQIESEIQIDSQISTDDESHSFNSPRNSDQVLSSYILPLASKQTKKNPTFNSTYEIIEELGEGSSSQVYLAREIANPSKQVALKIIRSEFMKQEDSMKAILNEINVLKSLDHKNINKLISFGTNGELNDHSGNVERQLVYFVLEYKPKTMLDVHQSCGAMGEDAARFLMKQIVDALKYMHQQKKTIHRDLKLENLLIDDDLNLQICDFGFAAQRNISNLRGYKGTKAYMAPEIKSEKCYDGRKIDIFSLGIIMFVMVQGQFPFTESKLNSNYKLLMTGDQLEIDWFWRSINSQNLSNEFKSLFLKMVNIDPSQRPTIDELSKDPWMQMPYKAEEIRNKLMDQLNCHNDLIEEVSEGSLDSETEQEFQDILTHLENGQDLKKQYASGDLQSMKKTDNIEQFEIKYVYTKNEPKQDYSQHSGKDLGIISTLYQLAFGACLNKQYEQ